MFLDQATIQVSGGSGGNGCVSWRREKGEPRGGPNGGDGGDGGDAIVLADPNADTLSDFASRKRFKAENGEGGRGKNCAGHNGQDLILRVPPGTILSEVQEDGSTKQIADLSNSGDQMVVAHGGRGGFGNAHFTSSTRQAPDFAELGEPGETRRITMELKLVADAGIIGYPSVGKSSLIAAVSHARPKIADYPFTTLVPNLGVVSVVGREFVLCDVPGLIEGASEGKGLGHAFLKHIERCGILIHLLDVSRDDIVADYKAIRKELNNHSPALSERHEFVVLNKVDLVGNDAAPWLAALKKAKIKVFGSISAATHHGTNDLMKALLPAIIEERDRRRLAEEILSDDLNELPVLKPHLLVDRMGAFRIERRDEGVLMVSGKRIERLVAMTDIQSIGAVNRLRNVFERIGLKKAVEREMKPGDRVFVGEKRVDEAIW